jgi:hypothetical protein
VFGFPLALFRAAFAVKPKIEGEHHGNKDHEEADSEVWQEGSEG